MQEHLIDTPTCVIAFATANHSFITGIGHHEFGNTLRALGLAHVLVRDHGHWYHRGIVGRDMQETADYFGELRKRYRRLVMVGASYGAHGALLFGPMIPADEVIAISPVKDVGEWLRYWQQGDADYDLPPVSSDVPKVRAFIGTGSKSDLDAKTCMRLNLRDVTVFKGLGHAGVARYMRDEGWFGKLLC